MADMLSTIGKLLAHAERAGTVEEAGTYFAKAQSLATREAIDLAVAAQAHERARRTEHPTSRRVTVVPEGLSAYYRTGYARLFTTIAVVNDLEVDIARRADYVILFGFPTDIDVVERLYASVLIQMVAAADQRIRDKAHHRIDGVDEWGQPVRCQIDARRYRNSFYAGYAGTIRDRLSTARDAAVADARRDAAAAGDGGRAGEVALVLADKRAKVRAHHAATSTARGTWRGSRSRGSGAAIRHGADAGHKAVLSTRRAVPGARRALT